MSKPLFTPTDAIQIQRITNGYLVTAGNAAFPRETDLHHTETLDAAFRLALKEFEGRDRSRKGLDYGQVCVYRTKGKGRE